MAACKFRTEYFFRPFIQTAAAFFSLIGAAFALGVVCTMASLQPFFTLIDNEYHYHWNEQFTL